MKKPFSKKTKKQLKHHGFTLIELLASVAIFGVISTMILSILFIGIRGGKKSDLENSIRQNGNIALSQIERNVRFARNLNSPVTCVPQVVISPPSFTVTSLSDSQQSTYTCSTGPSGTIASNGASLINTTAFSVQSCSFVCTQPTANDPPTITISFTLTAKSPTSNSFVESNALIPFETSVTLQNANQGL